MSANGTPQGDLYQMRPNNTTRDRSMEQFYTNSGNPYGYVPQFGGASAYGNMDPIGGQNPALSRYTPPMQSGGPWGAVNFQQGPYSYNLPNSFGTGTLPSGAQFMPQFQPPPGMLQALQNSGSMIPPPTQQQGGGQAPQPLNPQVSSGDGFSRSVPAPQPVPIPASSNGTTLSNEQLAQQMAPILNGGGNFYPGHSATLYPNGGLPVGPAPQFAPRFRGNIRGRMPMPYNGGRFMPTFGVR